MKDVRVFAYAFVSAAVLVACGTSGSGCPGYVPLAMLPPPQPSTGGGGPASSLRVPAGHRRALDSGGCPAPPVYSPLPTLHPTHSPTTH